MNLRNQFYILFEDNDFDSFLIKHIQYNIQHKIWLLKYNKYSKINISILGGDERNEAFEITWNDKRTAKISVFCNREFVANLEAKASIEFIYAIIFRSLDILWKENGWNVEDLISIQEEIRSEDYEVIVPIKTTLRLSDKKETVNIVCKLYPRFAEYFFRVEKKKEVQDVRFFRGISDLGIFFGHFSIFRVKDNNSISVSDAEGELNHVLNLTTYEYQRIYAPKINSLGNCKKIMEAFESADPKEISRVMKLY
ncbi:MAG: hypothetical protein H7Y07_04220 [Pyrinomonadaceae bacterium]|nr:hypothetical protein [Sphingobacteriaceae bacterium]